MFRIIIILTLLSTSVSALQLEELDDAVCCVGDMDYCRPITSFHWRQVNGGIELESFNEQWCRVDTIRRYPVRRIFNGQPADPCQGLICFSPRRQEH